MENVVRVQDRFWTQSRQLSIGLSVGVGVVWPILLYTTGLPGGWLGFITWAAVGDLFLVLFTAIMGSSYEARSLTISSSGVAFRVLGRPIEVDWDSVQPQLMTSYRNRLLILFRARGSKVVRRAVLTSEQGRALLLHPSAPKWLGPPDVLKGWGLSTPLSIQK
jgi:hypothetical protein